MFSICSLFKNSAVFNFLKTEISVCTENIPVLMFKTYIYGIFILTRTESIQ